MNIFSALLAGVSHGTTSIMGVITALCGAGTLMGLIPAPWSAVAMGVCGIVNGLGLIAAPDANKVVLKS